MKTQESKKTEHWGLIDLINHRLATCAELERDAALQGFFGFRSERSECSFFLLKNRRFLSKKPKRSCCCIGVQPIQRNCVLVGKANKK